MPRSYTFLIARAMWSLALTQTLAMPLNADVGEISLPEITIAGRQTQEDRAYGLSSATAIERSDFTAAGRRSVLDTLRGYPGLNVQAASRGAQSAIHLRGELGSFGHITVDDIPLFTTAPVFFNLAPFATEAIERADVIRGPSAMRYGSQALGGVVRLFTRDSHESNAFLRVEGGSFATAAETLGGSLAGKAGRMTITVNRDDQFDGSNQSDTSNGNRENDPYHASLAAMRFAAMPTSSINLDGSLLYSYSRKQIDSPGLLPSGRLSLGPFGQMDDPNAFDNEELWLAQQKTTVKLTPDWQSALQFGFTQNTTRARVARVQTTPNPFWFQSQLLLARWQNQHGLKFGNNAGRRFDINWGGEFQNIEGEASPVIRGLGADRRTISAGFLDLVFTAVNWSANTGVRLNHYDDYGSHLNYYAGMGWQITPQLKFRGSGAIGYRPPMPNERLIGREAGLGSSDLRPERSVSGELGVDWTPLQNMRLSATGFYSRFDDLINFSIENGRFNTRNIDKARIQGLELEWRFNPTPKLAFGADYTLTLGKNILTRGGLPANVDANGKVLPRRPDHVARVFTQWQMGNLPLTLYIEGIYRGQQWDNLANTVLLNPGFFMNAQLSYQFSHNLMLYLRGENMLDEQTSGAAGFGFPGAAVYGGVRVSLH